MSQPPPISQPISTYSVGLLLFASAIYILYCAFPQALRSSGGKTLPYPPGPPPKDWLSGHARYFFSPKLWLLYTYWGDKYGKPCFFKIIKRSVNQTSRTYRASQGIRKTHNSFKFYGRCSRTAREAIQQLLWSSIYSNGQSVRTTLDATKCTHVIWNIGIGWTFTTAFKSYGDDWHKHRRLLQQTFRPSASLEYRPKQAEKVVDFLHDLLEDPDRYMVHIRK